MIYKGKKLREIVFPIGGIGTGSVSLMGNGRFFDWEIFNKPNKGSMNGYSHFAVVANANGNRNTKILNGDLPKDYMGQYLPEGSRGYGFGPRKESMAGYPHFKNCTFKGEFPVSEISFKDDDFPGKVKLVSFNPLIPLDSFNSSLPAAFFEIVFENTTNDDIEYSGVLSIENPCGYSLNEKEVFDGVSSVTLYNKNEKKDDGRDGQITVSCICENSNAQEYWYRGGWQDRVTTYFNELTNEHGLTDRHYDSIGSYDVCSVYGSVLVKAHSKKSIRYVMSWHYPSCTNYWNAELKGTSWKNYYATVFKDSKESNDYCQKHFDELFKKTNVFRNSIHHQTLDKSVIDAIASNLAVLKSPTVLRLEDGSFYGWEGVSEKFGSCEGTCQHVWNYAYALCFLFPDLELSLRNNELNYSLDENGKLEYRMSLPQGTNTGLEMPCVDGQMGTILKIYRDWKLSGDSEWIKNNWKKIKSILSYTWSDKNECEWDLNKDGVLEGRQHHTLDMELFGPSGWLEGFYLAALMAASKMAHFLNDYEFENECLNLYSSGKKWADENLFNGEYYKQNIDLKDRTIVDHFGCSNKYWNDEKNEIKYQIGEGCDIDQLCGQWHADICGLGDVFDREQTKISLQSMFKYNYKPTMRDFINHWRIYSLNDESGAIICDYPKNASKPFIPIPYCDETMTGFEYQLAGELFANGFSELGTKVVKAVRDRYDGELRNPYNEIECGSNYARSMASFALLPIISGFIFDLPNETIGFNGKNELDYEKYAFFTATGWGTYEKSKSKIKIALDSGFLAISQLVLHNMNKISSLSIDEKMVDFIAENDKLKFEKRNVLKNIVISLN